ncbi:MAG: EMC3/TMCO1 family protein, partial [archaeon]
LLQYSVNIGMLVIAGIITLLITLVQKYTTDQALLKQMKVEQKILSEEMKKYKDHPEKVMELQKKQLEFLPKTMEVTTRPLIFTSVPIILFFRWFNDYFATNPQHVFGLGWIWAYLIISIIFSIIFRKVFDVA